MAKPDNEINYFHSILCGCKREVSYRLITFVNLWAF